MLHADLRRQTSDLHARLDAGLPLMRDGLTRGAYTDFLVRMLAWLQPTEQVLAQQLPATNVQVPLVDRSAWLAEDLRTLGAALPVNAPAERLAVLDSPAHAVGCWYVIEGSSLGGQVISRRLRQHLGVTGDHGARYFAGSGPATAARWREVCGALARYDGSARDVIEGARRSFESLHVWLQ